MQIKVILGTIYTIWARNDAIPAIDHDLFDSVNKSAIQLTTELVTELVMLFMQEWSRFQWLRGNNGKVVREESAWSKTINDLYLYLYSW